MPRQDVNQWDARKRRIHAPFRAPCSSALFSLPLCSLEFRPSACVLPFFSPRVLFSIRRRAGFLLFAWLAAAERKDTKRKRAELDRFSHLGLFTPLSLSLVLFLASSSQALLLAVVAAARWFVNAKFKLSHAIHPATPMKVPTHPLFPNPPPPIPPPPPPLPRDVPPQTPKRAYQ